VHAVELAFEFKTQLNFFLVILTVLHVLLFQLESQSALIGPLTFKLLRILLEHLHILLQYLLIVEEILALLLEVLLHFGDLFFVLVRDL
jgi:hypothetical protein